MQQVASAEMRVGVVAMVATGFRFLRWFEAEVERGRAKKVIRVTGSELVQQNPPKPTPSPTFLPIHVSLALESKSMGSSRHSVSSNHTYDLPLIHVRPFSRTYSIVSVPKCTLHTAQLMIPPSFKYRESEGVGDLRAEVVQKDYYSTARNAAPPGFIGGIWECNYRLGFSTLLVLYENWRNPPAKLLALQ